MTAGLVEVTVVISPESIPARVGPKTFSSV